MLSSNPSPVHPISAGSKPDLEESCTGFPFTMYPFGASPAREASDIAQAALPLVHACTGVTPLVGAPVSAAIGGLLGILRVINRRQEDPQNIEQSFAAPTASHLAGTIALGCMTLVDATGHHHPISVNCCTSYQQLNNMLRVLFERNAIEAQIQRRYIKQGKYDSCIDQGMQIVVRVTIQQETGSGSTDFILRHRELPWRQVCEILDSKAGFCSTDCR
ncbi:hypothetical protein BDR04DRAFT_1229621 [Suillus decipiens]|nr:hypothetical protein BDR04DRAFT_1229621 [Suillus decipiens]